MKAAALFIALSLGALAQSPDSNRLATSQAFLAGSIALDIASSYTSPGYEANPILGRWGNRQAATMASMTAALIICEHLAVKRWPKLSKPFAIVNFAAGAPHVWAGIHNLKLRARKEAK